MRTLTAELIKETFEAAFLGMELKRDGNRWVLLLPWGRQVFITDNGVDFTGIRQLQPGEVEDSREQLQFELMMFQVEVWGCVDTRKLPFRERNALWAYAKAYGFPVDDNSFRPFGIVDAKAGFGEAATVTNSWFPLGWKITVPDVGFVVIGQEGRELLIRKMEGNLYEETLRFIQKRQPHAVVRGKLPFCSQWVVYGETLNVRVVPEIPRSLLSIYMFGHVTTAVWALVAFAIQSIFPNAPVWVGIGIGFLAAAIVYGIFAGNDCKRGEVLLNKFPQMGSRNAKLDNAREREML